MAPILSFLISSWSKQEEPIYICLREVKVSFILKILMIYGSKKGTQIYYSFLSKVPANEPPSSFPKRDPIEREARLQGILHISQKPHLSDSPVKESSDVDRWKVLDYIPNDKNLCYTVKLLAPELFF